MDGLEGRWWGKYRYRPDCVPTGVCALCCACAVNAAGHSLQGSTGLYRGLEETHLAHSIEHGI